MTKDDSRVLRYAARHTAISVGEIANSLDVLYGSAARRLSRLERNGLLVWVGAGVYRISEKGRAQSQET